METVDEVWDAWKILFFQAVERNIPSKQLKPQRNAPWFNAEVLKLIRKKRRLWKQAKSSEDPAKAWFKRRTFHEPNLIVPIKYMTRSTFESIKFNKCYLGRPED